MTGYSIDVDAMRERQASPPSVEDNSKTASTASNKSPEDGGSGSSSNEFSGWNLLCQAIDRILFAAYFAIILIFIASYLGGAAVDDTSMVSTIDGDDSDKS